EVIASHTTHRNWVAEATQAAPHPGGRGGGRCAKTCCRSGTSPALVHCAIPCRQTSVSRGSVPDRALSCNRVRSKGPDCCPPVATCHTAGDCPGTGGAPPAPPCCVLAYICPIWLAIAKPIPMPMPLAPAPPGFSAAFSIAFAAWNCAYF